MPEASRKTSKISRALPFHRDKPFDADLGWVTNDLPVSQASSLSVLVIETAIIQSWLSRHFIRREQPFAVDACSWPLRSIDKMTEAIYGIILNIKHIYCRILLVKLTLTRRFSQEVLR